MPKSQTNYHRRQNDAATFGYPEIDLGLIEALHFVQLPRLVSKHQAFGPPFLGDPFDAATAFRMGLVSDVVAKGTARDRAWDIARRFAEKSPIVMKIGRDVLMRALDADYRRVIENAAESFALVATTQDCQEGLDAFVEKRAAEIYRTLTKQSVDRNQHLRKGKPWQAYTSRNSRSAGNFIMNSAGPSPRWTIPCSAC